MLLLGQYQIAVPALLRGRYLVALPVVTFLAAIIHILRPPGLYEYPLTACYTHTSSEERGRAQLRSLLSGIEPQPELSDGWKEQGHTYTEVPPNRVCAFNADDRPLLSIDEMGLHDPRFLRTRTPESRDEPETGPSLAFYLNKLWAIRHGYRLTRENGQSIPGRIELWNKMGAIKNMTMDASCEYIVYMDSDLYIRAQEYSLMDMRRRWGMHDRVVLALSWDVVPGWGDYNTGFMIMRNGPALERIVDDWIACPDEVEGCERWSMFGPGDQGAFGEFIVGRLADEGTAIGIPCEDALGNERVGETGSKCTGNIVTHHFGMDKQDLAQEAVQMTALQLMRLIEAL